jgi:hypothetical protein
MKCAERCRCTLKKFLRRCHCKPLFGEAVPPPEERLLHTAKSVGFAMIVFPSKKGALRCGGIQNDINEGAASFIIENGWQL